MISAIMITIVAARSALSMIILSVGSSVGESLPVITSKTGPGLMCVSISGGLGASTAREPRVACGNNELARIFR
jgi:hypothetical protein